MKPLPLAQGIVEDEAESIIRTLRRRGFTAADMNLIIPRANQMILELLVQERKKNERRDGKNLFNER